LPLTGHEGRKHVAPQIPSQPNNATDKAPHEDSCRALPGALRPRSSQLRLRSRVRGALNSGRGAGGAWTVVKAPDFCGRCALLPQMSPGGGIGPLPCPRQGAHPVVGASGRHGAPPPRASGPPSRPPCLLPCAGLNSPPGTSAPARNTLPATHVTQTPCFAPGSRRGRLVASSVATGSVPAATSLFVGMEEKAPRKTMKSEWRGIQVSGRGFGGRSGRHSGRSPTLSREDDAADGRPRGPASAPRRRIARSMRLISARRPLTPAASSPRSFHWSVPPARASLRGMKATWSGRGT